MRLYIELAAGLPFALVVCAAADADGGIAGSGHTALLGITTPKVGLLHGQRNRKRPSEDLNFQTA
ncbi:hypothetical protein [Neisseria dentiae]|uniref:hypothetical protein n=1 Tax=Neisseria dentiae TaxID=194197 RepID=UPI00359F2BF3